MNSTFSQNHTTCSSCGEVISEARLRAIPHTTLCIRCASENDVPRTKGYMSWEHKTAPALILGPDAESLLHYDKRRFFGSSLRLNSPKNFRISESMKDRNLSQTVKETEPSTDTTPFETVNRAPAVCHPERERVSPDGKCLQCVQEWYTRRRSK